MFDLIWNSSHLYELFLQIWALARTRAHYSNMKDGRCCKKGCMYEFGRRIRITARYWIDARVKGKLPMYVVTCFFRLNGRRARQIKQSACKDATCGSAFHQDSEDDAA